MNKIKTIIDTDPGIDDLLAIAVALESEKLDVIAMSTVFGNVSLDDTTQNAELICDILNKDMQIIRGAHKPLVYDRKHDASVHGTDGLAGLRTHYRSQVEEKNKAIEGVHHLHKLIKESDEKITIIALGPLTNIATLLLSDPSIKDNIKEIHIMGGGDRIGNTTELAEFNFYSDSYAAKVVMNSGIPMTISGLDVTRKVYFTNEELSSLHDHSLKQKFIVDSVKYYANLDPFMHDICAVLTLIEPELFTYTDVQTDVITAEGKVDGMQYILREPKNKTTRLVDTNKRKEIIDYVFNLIENKFK